MSGFWGGLTFPERTALEAAGSISRFPAESTIFLEQDTTDHVLVIQAGLAKVYARADANRDVLLAVREAGDIIGEMASMTRGPRTATVVAIGDVDALLVKADQFAAFLGRYSHALTVLNGVLVDRLHDCVGYRVAAATMSTGRRLARLLLRLADRYGTPSGGGGMRLALALSQDDLAAFVGASQRAVAREMQDWRQRGIVTTGRRWVVIRRPDTLRRIAGLPTPPP